MLCVWLENLDLFELFDRTHTYVIILKFAHTEVLLYGSIPALNKSAGIFQSWTVKAVVESEPINIVSLSCVKL